MSALGTSLLELIRRTACDLPADVDHALDTALKGEEPGTNGESAIEMFLRAAIRGRQERIPLGGDPAALRFTVDAPPGFDRDAFRAAADIAAHAAAEEGVIRTDFVDLPGGRPRRGMQLGAPPVISFRDVPAPTGVGGATRVNLRIVSYFESGATAQRTIPGPGAPGVPTLDGVVSVVLAAIHEQQGRPAGPGLIGIHIGADPVSGLAAAEAELLRPIDDRNPQRPLAQLESRIAERVNQLGIGPLALGGRTTILGAKVAVDPAPADRWAISIAISSWALRRQTVSISPDGQIRAWETAITEEGAAKSASRLAARFAARLAAQKAAEKAAKAAAAAAKAAATKPSVAKAPVAKAAGAKSSAAKPAAKGLPASGSGAQRKEPAPSAALPKSPPPKTAPLPAGASKAAPPKSATPPTSAPVPTAGSAPTPAKAAPPPPPLPPAGKGAPAAPKSPPASGSKTALAKGSTPPAEKSATKAPAKPAAAKPAAAKPAAAKPAAAKPTAPAKSPPSGAAKSVAKPVPAKAAKKPANAAPAKNSKKPEKRK